MMVTFVSECEKKALNRTRRVLDSFANRSEPCEHAKPVKAINRKVDADTVSARTVLEAHVVIAPSPGC